MKSRITKTIEDRGLCVFNYTQLVSACLLNAPTIVVADFMDLNLCEAIRAREQDGLEEGKHGLETWMVLIDGRVLHSFLSEQVARTRFAQLCTKLGLN